VILSWGRYNGWEPQGGQRKAWRDLAPGDLIELQRKIWRVAEVRLVPAIDWDEHDREQWEKARRAYRLGSEEDWAARPVYLILYPAGGGKRHHVKIRSWRYWGREAYALPEHYPVCRDCGEPWPCPELEITQEIERESAKVERLEKILPGCCWSCGDPVTSKQASIRFDGDNLLLPGASPPVFHLRRKGQCRSDAASYEKRWVAAGEGRRWRLQCPGKLIRHVDGDECTEDPFCPGGDASHNTFTCHAYGRLPDGSARSVYGVDFRCLRCEDALERKGLSIGEPPPGALL